MSPYDRGSRLISLCKHRQTTSVSLWLSADVTLFFGGTLLSLRLFSLTHHSRPATLCSLQWHPFVAPPQLSTQNHTLPPNHPLLPGTPGKKQHTTRDNRPRLPFHRTWTKRTFPAFGRHRTSPPSGTRLKNERALVGPCDFCKESTLRMSTDTHSVDSCMNRTVQLAHVHFFSQTSARGIFLGSKPHLQIMKIAENEPRFLRPRVILPEGETKIFETKSATHLL